MKQNLGKLDRIFRFGLAFWWLGPWAPQFSLNGGFSTIWFNSMILMNWLVVAVAWIALFESFVGWCWLHTLLNINNKAQ